MRAPPTWGPRSPPTGAGGPKKGGQCQIHQSCLWPLSLARGKHIASITSFQPQKLCEGWNSPHFPEEETPTQTPRSFKALSHVTELGGTRAHVCVILKSTSCPCSQSLLGVIPATSAGGPKRSCEEDPGATTCPAGVPGRAGGGAGQAAKKPQGHARLTHWGLSVQPPPPP